MQVSALMYLAGSGRRPPRREGGVAGRPGQYLGDLVGGEGRVGEVAQVLLDQVGEPSGPGGRASPAGGGGLQYPPPVGGLLPRGFQGGQGGVQIPGREGPSGLVG